jgi:DNA replication and repair protein RecF
MVENYMMTETIPIPSAYGLTRLSLTAFRSYEQLLIKCDARPVVLTGENGEGKTNILEAISLLSPGKGFRNAKSEHILNRDCPDRSWAVAAHIDTPHGETQVGFGLDPEAFARGRDRRLVRINQTTVRSQTELSQHLQVIWLTPNMDRLLQDSPSDRRQFLDRLVFGLDHEHANRVKRYEHATRERLHLLKDGPATDAWLGALETAMIENGIAITLAREETINKLKDQLNKATTRFPRAHLKMTGFVDDLFAEGKHEEEVAELYRRKLIENREKDGLIGMTRTGPHRSDFLCFFDDQETPAAQCSTGEQKALLLSITLAAARMQRELKKGVPILLLDEVVAHLDPHRRRDLFDEIEALQLQTWMSGTDSHLFKDFGDRAQHFCVENGILSPKNVL